MDPKYLLQQLFEKVALMRKAQKEYYGCREKFDHPLKRAHLQEAQRREQDLDRLMVQLKVAMPSLGQPSASSKS